MVTGTVPRRGFLRNVALAVGAVLVGVGRNAQGVPEITMNPFCTECVRDNSECEDDEGRKRCPRNSVPLDWQTQGGRCVECYESQAAADKAEQEAKKPGSDGRPACNYCIGVRCGYYTGRGFQDKEREAWGTDPEDPLDLGCRDPDTGIYYLWPEPGTPCSIYDPTPTPHDPP